MLAESNGTTSQSSTACKLCEVSTSGCLRYTVRIPTFNAVTIMTLLCNDLVWTYLALRHWTGVFCSPQSFIIIIPHLLPHTKMDDSVTLKKMKHFQQPLVVEWNKRSPSAPYHFRLHKSLLKLKVLSKYTHGHHDCPLRVCHTSGSGLFLSKVIEITNFTGEYGELYFHLWMKSCYLPVKVMENKSRSGCVIMRVSVEGGCSQCC